MAKSQEWEAMKTEAERRAGEMIVMVSKENSEEMRVGIIVAMVKLTQMRNIVMMR